MKTTTLLEVMADVAHMAAGLDVDGQPAGSLAASLASHAETAAERRGSDRRLALKYAAALAILALHAHDAEAAQAASATD